MVNYSLESLGQSFRSGNRPTEMELELEMASIRDGMSELGAESDMLDRAFNSAELAMNIIKNFKDEDQCLELLKCQATMESLINVNGGTIDDLTVSAAQEGIKEFFKTIWEKIKAFFAKLWDYTKRFFTWLGEKLGLTKNKIDKVKQAFEKADKKKVNQLLLEYKPNAGKSKATESLSSGMEAFADIKDMTVEMYPADVLDKVSKDLVYIVCDDFMEKDPKFKRFFEIAYSIDKESFWTQPIEDLEKIRDELNEFQDSLTGTTITHGSVSISIGSGHYTLNTSVGIDKISKGTMYELGYRSVEQITQLLSRFAKVIVTVKNEGPASAAERAHSIHMKNSVDRAAQHMEESATEENRHLASVCATIYRLIGNTLRRLSAMEIKGSKLLDMIIEGACEELYRLVRKAGGDIGFVDSKFVTNTIPA